jgi:hypothetical protein
MTFWVGFIVGMLSGFILVFLGIFIWWYRGANLVTGIFPDDEAMWNERKENEMGSSQKT